MFLRRGADDTNDAYTVRIPLPPPLFGYIPTDLKVVGVADSTRPQTKVNPKSNWSCKWLKQDSRSLILLKFEMTNACCDHVETFLTNIIRGNQQLLRPKSRVHKKRGSFLFAAGQRIELSDRNRYFWPKFFRARNLILKNLSAFGTPVIFNSSCCIIGAAPEILNVSSRTLRVLGEIMQTAF